MLSKKRRIDREIFPYILSHNKKINSKHLLLYLSRQKVEKPSQFSFSVSKKISNSAVKRNKLRRWGYEVITSLENKVKPGYFLFFQFKKNSEPLTFNKSKEEILELLNSGAVIR